jgi:hypothetical protein
MEPFVSATDLDPRALRRLVRDSLLQTSAPGSDLYAPAHDVFEDWALMRWLDEGLDQHGRQLDSLVESLGTYPAVRRAYRGWLTECLDVDPQSTDSLALALIQNPNVAAHWREDTLVSVLQSGVDGSGYPTFHGDGRFVDRWILGGLGSAHEIWPSVSDRRSLNCKGRVALVASHSLAESLARW